MKKAYLILILLTLLYSCFSCKGRDGKEKVVIGVSQCSDDLWRQRMNTEMLLEASSYENMELVIKTVKDDTRKQIKDIEELINQKVDLLVISPNESTAITPIIQKAYQSGIPVILVDRRIDTEDYTAYVGADNYLIGQEVGLYISGVLNGKGNIVEIRGWQGSTSDNERHAGFVDAISKFPNIKVIAERRGNYLKEEAKKQMTDVLKTESKIDLVFAFNDPMALGVREAVSKYSGKLPFIIGIDALPDEGGGIEGIQKGLIDASFIYPTGGSKVTNLAMKIIRDESFSRENILFTSVVDKSNVRVLQLQTEQILTHQHKLEKMNEVLDKSIAEYTTQKSFSIIILLVLILTVILLVVSLLAYLVKNKSNKRLREQQRQLVSLSEQLQEATNAKLVFFTNISHEFRTPLTLILGPIDTLSKADNLSTEQQNLLSLVKRNSGTLQNLISQIIEFRSFENGKMNTYFSEGDLNHFLEELNIPFIDYANRMNVKFVYSSDNTSFVLPFDKEKVERIYFNLLSNAFKYIDFERNIEVSLSQVEKSGKKYAELSIYNDSKEIPKDKINKIFDRFFKVDQSSVGTGIGLALTSVLVELHHGEIWVENDNNKGITFKVIFPFDQDKIIETNEVFYQGSRIEQLLAQDALPTEEDTAKVPILMDEEDEKAIILIIEDNQDMRNYMRIILSKEYTIIEARNGVEGFDLAKKHIPDVIISDVMMPERDGFETCKFIKEHITTSHIPIILLTACSLDEQKAIGFESGADAYIAKPFNAEILQIRIRKLIENRQKMKDILGSGFIDEQKGNSLANIEKDFLNQFKHYVEERISDPDLNVVDVAKALSLSRVQLYRKVKSLSNYSPNELIRIIRLKKASYMLGTNIPIAEVAYQTGFSSASYFTKCFKEFYGINPSEY